MKKTIQTLDVEGVGYSNEDRKNVEKQWNFISETDILSIMAESHRGGGLYANV